MDYLCRSMNKYTKYIIISASLTILSVIGSAYLTAPYRHVGTVGVAVFWIAGLGSFFLRGYEWYKKDMLKRAKEVEEEDKDTKRKEKSEIERLFD